MAEDGRAWEEAKSLDEAGSRQWTTRITVLVGRWFSLFCHLSLFICHFSFCFAFLLYVNSNLSLLFFTQLQSNTVCVSKGDNE